MKRILAILCAALLAFNVNAATLLPIQLLNPAGSSSGQAIISTGSSTAPAWGGVPVSGLAAIAANTVLANATSASAAPTAFAMPSCSTTASALGWTTSTGFTCNTGINAATLGGSTFASPPSAGYGSVTPEPISATTIISSGGANLNNLTVTSASSLQGINTITGITSGTNGASGIIGQCIQGIVPSTSAVPLSNGAGTNLTSISLTAGDWLVFGAIDFNIGSSTTINYIAGDASTASAALVSGNFFMVSSPNGTLSTISGAAIPEQRINVSTTTTVFLVAQASFGGSTLAAFGNITACRWH